MRNPRRPPLPRLVARVRALDLDDVGPERGEDLRAVRPCERRREVEDADAFEREEAHAMIVWSERSGLLCHRLHGLTSV